jgi:hypothetical protein
MKNRILWALAALNVLLVVTLAARFSSENAAVAQARRPADYIMIPGEISGGSSAVVYIIDTSNGLLGAGTYDDSRREINTMPPIDLARVFQTGPATPPRGPAGGAGGAGAVGPGVGTGNARPPAR